MNQLPLISLNGRLLKAGEATLSVVDQAAWYNFGVYESIKILRGKIFFPDLHVQRLYQSAELIGLNIGFGQTEIVKWINDLVASQRLKDNLLRLAVYGDAEKNQRAQVYIIPFGLTFYPDKFYARGISCITYPGERFLPAAKSFNMLVNFLALKEAKQQGALEAILIDKQGNAAEGTRSNLFIVEKDKLITPPDAEVLVGVTKLLLERLIAKNQLPLVKEPINQQRLLKADEVLITSTSMNVMPVNKIDGAIIGSGQVGPLTRRLRKLFSDFQKDYLKDNKQGG